MVTFGARLASEPEIMQTVTQTGEVVRFGVFEADLSLGELRKNGTKIKVQELPFRALKLLLSHPNQVLSRDQFRQALWPDGVFVDFDHSISSAINRLRDALGDSAENPIFIQTIERRGYRWIAPIHVPEAGAQPDGDRPGPVLIKSQAVTQVARAGSLFSWRWSLLFPVAALLFLVWVIWPSHRPARAGNVPTTSNPVPASRQSETSEAEQFYLKGRFYWEKRTPEGLNKALDFFTQAIVHDQNYAPAYVGLADCYNLLREYTLMPASEAYPRALAAAQKAVELDDHSSEAHASLAFASFWGNWDVAGAEREFRRAIELNPNNAVAHHWYATYLSAIGRHPESLGEIERAQTLEPASKAIIADKGNLLCAAGRCDEGIALLKQLETAEPDFVSPHRYLKDAYFETGDYPSYLREWKTEAVLMKDSSCLKVVDAATRGYAAGGRQGMLQSIRAQQASLYQQELISPYSLAQTNATLGNKEDAMQLLRLAYAKHDERVIQIASDPAFASMRQEAAFHGLVSRLGLPSPE